MKASIDIIRRGNFGFMIGMCAALTFGGCTSLNGGGADDLGGRADALQTLYPEIDFSARPSYLAERTLAFTFDDGPDYNNTAKVLDILKANQLKSTFFINVQNWSNILTDSPMQDLVRRMVQEGHELANHTANHPRLASLGAAEIEAELAGVESAVKGLLGPTAPRLTLFRAPYGEPYQGNDSASPSAAYTRVSPIVAKHAVEIGWAIDAFDYNCPTGDGACVLANLRSALESGAYGVVLLHCVHESTVNGLQGMIDYARSHGYRFAQVEDVVRARFGKSSAELVTGAPCAPSCGGKACGDDGCGGSCGACGQDSTCDAAGQCLASTKPSTEPTSTSPGTGPSTSPSTGSCAGVTPWHANKPWYEYQTGEIHTGSNNHLYQCKNVAYCIYNPTDYFGFTYGWTDQGAC